MGVDGEDGSGEDEVPALICGQWFGWQFSERITLMIP